MKFFKFISASAVLATILFLPISYSLEAAVNSSAVPYGASPDAIAIRVMPNLDHSSPLVWYGKNVKLKGSPQNLLVDGYEAVRDGRTVYVSAANISGNDFYTNIYIISYNQDAENSTIDIFGQILSHWKFNVNPEIDNNQKQKIVRDVKRLADLQDMKLALANYKKDVFPRLKSGSYMAGASTSKWPSWQATLGKELGITMPHDPIDKLGSCPVGYDEATCWNQAIKDFYFKFNSDSADDKSISKFPIYWYEDGVFHAGLETSYEIKPPVANVSFNVTAP